MTSTDRPGQARRPRPHDWAVVVVVAGAAGVSQTFGRFTYSLLLTDVRDGFGLSNTLAGGLGTVNLAAYLTGVIVVTLIVQRVGLSTLTRLGLVGSTLGVGLLAWSPNVPTLLVAQVITGLSGASVWVTAPALAADRLGPSLRGFAIGAAGTGLGVAMIMASAVEASVATDRWRTVYALEALVALPILALAIWLFRDEPSSASAPIGASGLRTIRTLPGGLRLIGSYACYGLSLALFTTFLVASLEDDSGYAPSESATAFLVFGVGTVVGGPFLGSVSDRLGRPRALLFAFALMTGAALTVPTGVRPWPTVAAFAFGLAFTGIPAGVAARIRDHVEGPSFGAAFGAATLAFGSALMIGPQLGGALADATGSFLAGFVVAAAAAIGGGALLLVDRHRPPTEPAPP